MVEQVQVEVVVNLMDVETLKKWWSENILINQIINTYIHSKQQVVTNDDVDMEQEVEVQKEQPAVEPDMQEGVDIGQVELDEKEQPAVEPDEEADDGIEEMGVGAGVQWAVQFTDVWGYSESVGHVQPVLPGPDAMQKYLEGLGS